MEENKLASACWFPIRWKTVTERSLITKQGAMRTFWLLDMATVLQKQYGVVRVIFRCPVSPKVHVKHLYRVKINSCLYPIAWEIL